MQSERSDIDTVRSSKGCDKIVNARLRYPH
jgi:hypothetical protein